MAKGPTASLMKWKGFLSLPESIQKTSLQTKRGGKLMRDELANGEWTFNVGEQRPNEEVWEGVEIDDKIDTIRGHITKAEFIYFLVLEEGKLLRLHCRDGSELNRV